MNPRPPAPPLPLPLALPLLLLAAMLLPAARALRVAVLGSGPSGASAARALAEAGLSVTVFEAGRGVGGRTSTRKTRDDAGYQFDHGAQYISTPKTEEFRGALDAWRRDGWARPWEGRFCDAAAAPGEVATLEVDAEAKERWVGYPTMNAICHNLLDHEGISVELQTRANAAHDATRADGRRWTLASDRGQRPLGAFDWLVATDRTSAASYRRDLKTADVDDFRRRARGVRSAKSLAAMVAFDAPLALDADGIQFSASACGHLGWAARDTSKPGRARSDGRECWVLQSRPGAAERVLRGTKGQDVAQIRERAKDALVGDFLAFLASLPRLLREDARREEAPRVVHAVGHRWGAAFPVVPPSPSSSSSSSSSGGQGERASAAATTEEWCLALPDRRFVACGDYFGGPLAGRIEGAYLSGTAAARRLLRLHEQGAESRAR